ncbi:retrovirus-related pol polyprotein from transposon TNT 1-94 [Tanacetum coccineum]
MNRDSSFKNSVLSNTKKSSEKVEVSDRTNKKIDVASMNVTLNKKIVTDVDVKNALIAKNVLFRRALFTTLRTTKSTCDDTTPIASKTRFAVKTIQSMSLDTTPVVSKTKIATVTPLSAKNKVVQIVLQIVDSSCSKHMIGDRSLLKNFVKKFLGDDLLIRARESNLYTISISDMVASSPVCLLSKATSTKSWLWHHILSHINFGTINDLTKHDLVDGLSKFKYGKDHLCSTCERGKSKKSSHPPKLVLNSPSTSSTIVEEHEAPPIVTTSEEQTSPILMNEVDELNQEDSAEFDGNTLLTPYDTP